MIFIFMLLTIALFISVIRRIAKAEKRIAEIYAEQAAKPKRCAQCGRFMPADSAGDICNACLDAELDTDWATLQVGDKVMVAEIGSDPYVGEVTSVLDLCFVVDHKWGYTKTEGIAHGFGSSIFAKCISVVERVKHEKP